MALSPNIPTSFVPKMPVRTVAKASTSSFNLIGLIGVLFLIVALLGSAGVYAYGKYLDNAISVKGEEIKAAIAGVNSSTVEDFITLRNRFSAGKNLLESHIAFSQFLDVLEKATLQNVRFTSLRYVMEDNNVITVSMSGTAKSFNALAVESNTFAREPYIKGAIFSDITTQLDGTVTFSVNAKLDPELITMVNPLDQEVLQQQPATPRQFATSTPATSTATTTKATPSTSTPSGAAGTSSLPRL
jgi:hypothetical protein